MNIDEIVELYQIPEVGFSENEIIRAEQNIGVNLPSNYRNYLIQYGLAKINYVYNHLVATVYKGNMIKNLIMDCRSYT